jgi:phosphatidylinositol kinase/protein kinase (PI-3  family)
MCMVGYILGLGDRHPSNLMLDKVSGRILHIDFGDCFEVAMNRDKFPERIPFRLTRMLIKAMEISGIEGSYRSTCERTMTVLRGSRDSLVTMLEAFVYDPLISWRLAGLSPVDSSGTVPGQLGGNALQGGGNDRGVPIHRMARPSGVMIDAITELPDEDNMEDEDEEDNVVRQVAIPLHMHQSGGRGRGETGQSSVSAEETTAAANRLRSLQMYSNIQSLAANLATDSRIASITGQRSPSDQHEPGGLPVAGDGASLARSSRGLERSMKQQRESSFLLTRGEDGLARHEEAALNEKALKVIRRVQDKLQGTDFLDSCVGEPLDVADQVQRLVVQATSSENLCQLYVGWCSFW